MPARFSPSIDIEEIRRDREPVNVLPRVETSQLGEPPSGQLKAIQYCALFSDKAILSIFSSVFGEHAR